MLFLGFSLLMLALLVMAHIRTPQVGAIRAVWFVASLLPGELPWAFGIIQALATLAFIVNATDYSAITIIALLLSLFTLWFWYGLHRKTLAAETLLQSALQEGLGKDYVAQLAPDVGISAPSEIGKKNWMRPFSYYRPGVERLVDIAYGEHPRQRLDMYRPSLSETHKDKRVAQKTLCPVILHVHGGGWVVGNKYQQGQPLIRYLAQNGWICIDINYRLAPRHRYPDCLVDVKKAIVWLKENIAAYGGNPEFIAMTGGSAGGHLCILSALTANHAQYQPGFEHCDTRVQAVVPMYGVYDFTNSNLTWSGAALDKLLHRCVMPRAQQMDPDLWQNASPKFQDKKGAPPVFIIHGTTDALVFVEDVRDFVGVLRQESHAPVLYAELPGAQHGFDLFHGVRTEFTIEAVGKFLHYCYCRSLDEQ